MPVMPGSSTSVRTRSHDSEPASRSAAAGSAVCTTSKPFRTASTWITKLAASKSSSTRSIRPRGAAGPMVAMPLVSTPSATVGFTAAGRAGRRSPLPPVHRPQPPVVWWLPPVRRHDVAVAEAPDRLDRRAVAVALAELAAQPHDREFHPLRAYPQRIAPGLLK